jgi:hypothetical protein
MFRHACRLGFEGILFHKGCSIGSSSESSRAARASRSGRRAVQVGRVRRLRKVEKPGLQAAVNTRRDLGSGASGPALRMQAQHALSLGRLRALAPIEVGRQLKARPGVRPVVDRILESEGPG